MTTTRRRVLAKLGHPTVIITPTKASLLDDRAQLLKKIRKLQQSKDHLEALVQTRNLDSILEGVVSPALRSFVRGHLRNARRPGTARRWEQHKKVLALSVFKRSPRAYRLLCRFLCFLQLGRC